MNEEPQDYVRYALRSAGFTPTDEIVNQVYATATALALHPSIIVDDLIAALRAYAPAARSLEFIASMQQLQTQAGQTQEELGTVSQAILDMAVALPEEKPKQKMPYYQKDKAHWWKGRRPV